MIFKCVVLVCAVALAQLGAAGAGAQEDYSAPLTEARKLIAGGDYAAAIAIYDQILEEVPGTAQVLQLKGIAQSNSELHRESLITFRTILQDDPYDEVALAGTGLGFGNLGEYQESRRYFELAAGQNPESVVYKNYREFVDGVITKYPYEPTPKPAGASDRASVPRWVAGLASWWASGQASDEEFFGAIDYLISERIVVVPRAGIGEPAPVPYPSGDAFASWAAGDVDEEDIVRAIRSMAEAGLVRIPPEDPEEKASRDRDDLFLFKNYLGKIAANIEREKRYIEYPNPSGDVIKKFLRDYVKWNFDAEAERASTNFPSPAIEVDGNEVTVRYHVFVNQQPAGLPLDHEQTLADALRYWEAQTLRAEGNEVSIEFTTSATRRDANVWVTWVVRDLGEGVLGHAHVGKGIVEVALGGYACDGSFQLYDVDTVRSVMTHELGHSIGLGHSDNENSIMYPTLRPAYAYCLIPS